MKSLGQIAYEAYADTTGWKSAVSGAPLPAWDAQHDRIKQAWDAGAQAAVQSSDSEAQKLLDELGDAHTATGETMLAAVEEALEIMRWRCARVAESYEPRCESCPSGVAAAIRALPTLPTDAENVALQKERGG